VLDDLNDMLARLRSDNDLEFAAISADGMLVAADSVDGVDAEGICATAADGYLVMTALGVELQRGEQQMATIEYSEGTVLICPLEHGAVLVMLTGGNANLGRLRLAARRFRASYVQEAAAPAA
jgi:predicted regulator of Ras-like GTPase activity (Roadblock/LC7/MglB family)